VTDTFSREKRSEIMSKISRKNTSTEIAIRKIVFKMGYRYRLHVRELPGCPDLVLPKHKKIIFINGCFWHGHLNCNRSKRPKTNIDFWNKKIEGNISRDKIILGNLKKLGWRVLVIWQCQIKDQVIIKTILEDFLSN
jgi:DNA mismatch endonuclease, patch repair protein